MKSLRAVSAIVVLILLSSSPALAAISDPIITATVADTDTMTLLIEGFNLPKGGVYMGKVGGGAEKLKVLSYSPSAIEAQLLTTEPGTYLVAIFVYWDQFWTSSVTVGAIGPQGPKGDAGATGATGPQGAVGAPGPVRPPL